jgi:2,3-bisphosphoglycerate-dependent phosphoglycerate mutase
MPKLVLMRHGATLWGQENRFAGWGDTPLSDAGYKEAQSAAKILADANFKFDRYYTSELKRAQQTLAATVALYPEVRDSIQTDWRLNERHYGALQGETRAAMIEKYGNQQVVDWRRSFTAEPPPLPDSDPRWLEQLQRLPSINLADQPRTESMATAAARVAPVWHEHIAADLRQGGQVLVVAHTSSIRGLARAIENLSDSDSANFRIATAIPLVYEFDASLQLVAKTFLDTNVSGSFRRWFNRFKPRGLGWI